MTLDDIPEMIDAWLAGELRLHEVYHLCLDLMEHHEVELILSRLPAELRTHIESKLHEDWDHSTPPEECFIFDSGRGEHPATKVIIERARSWIHQRRRS